ncbi:MAG TPA: glycoside hydrolase family 2 TIM barrel-domain containing protein [Candidatus Limnocylindrales bacterium]|nr:glycoside hydrolase family 2 TIM barrel-domain containing protein [Candidatus Limnocylindrales bacterium]
MRGRATGAVSLVLILAPLVALSACSPAPSVASLKPTLRLQKVNGTWVGFQNGLPVPTFDAQPRLRLDLGGAWRVDRRELDTDLTLTDRTQSLPQIVQAAAGRQQPAYDDTHWRTQTLPGAAAPPDRTSGSGWYRRTFTVPPEWAGLNFTLNFGAVNYVADVWLNGIYLGYHEGGSTPFAFDATRAIRTGASNVLALRIDNPPLGIRNDIVPWGLTDWWNYGGILQPVWLDAHRSLYAVRADIVPHLDGIDVNVVLHNGGAAADHGMVQLEILPTVLNPASLLDPNPRTLVPADATPIVTDLVDPGPLGAGKVTVLHSSFLLGNTSAWSPQLPALYALHVVVLSAHGRSEDALYETFGLRRIAVDSRSAQLLLNGTPVSFQGAAVKNEDPFGPGNTPRGGPITDPGTFAAMLDEARRVHAQLIRAGHQPANPVLLMLADRLGFAVWEEIPLYHYTPQTYQIAMHRGIPQQMLAEMDLRDMDHPSVLFHGLSNESTGVQERLDALTQLRNLDRQLDGTRLTGQAAYGSDPRDGTSDPLDVAGYTFYYGVFYGDNAGAETAAALDAIHRRYPSKPVMALEFGHWADSRAQEQAQAQVFNETYPALAAHDGTNPNGYVGAMVWWSLNDYWTMVPGISVEHFGLFAPDGSGRLVAQAAASFFAGGAGEGARLRLESGGTGEPVTSPGESAPFLALLGYSLAVPLVILLGLFVAAAHRARRREPVVST